MDTNEPSVLDYLKSLVNPRNQNKIKLQDYAREFRQEGAVDWTEFDGQAVESAQVESVAGSGLVEGTGQENEIDAVQAVVGQGPKSGAIFQMEQNQQGEDDSREFNFRLRVPKRINWRILPALLLGLFAQRLMEPPADSIPMAVGLYVIAFVLLIWAFLDGEYALPDPEPVVQKQEALLYRPKSLMVAGILALAAFVALSDNLFTTFNVALWFAAIFFLLRAFWVPDGVSWQQRVARAWAFIKRDVWTLNITRGVVLLVLLAGVILFFRFYRLDGVPGEPFSDHAEKLLDVFDLMNGKTQIFFPRNTGREFVQFYLTAFLASVMSTGLSFFTLKTGTVLIGLFALPYIYLLGKEIGGKRVAFFALILAGTSYWLNTISRIGLRFPLYPAFAAPTLYYLIRGLRRQSRNDFILAGLFLGLGLHGYSPFRFVPLVVLLAVGLYLLHRQSGDNRKKTIILLMILVLASVFVFLPLMRYALENPDMFSTRAFSRLTESETKFTAPVWQIFLNNTFRAMMMFNYDDGEIWVHSIPHRPALDIVSAVLFAIGYIILIVRYLRKRSWLDAFLILSVPLLMMPSILSLAFPNENPSLNRTGAAAVTVFIIAAMALDGIYSGLKGKRKVGLLSIVTIALLLVFSAMQNYTLVFEKFSDQFLAGAWNTSDMGKVIHAFVLEGNDPNNAYVVPFPYWVDTRLVGIQAGYPAKDYALSRENIPSTLESSGSKLFIVKDEDQETLDMLKLVYPSGLQGEFISPLQGKNFWIYTVPANSLNIAP